MCTHFSVQPLFSLSQCFTVLRSLLFVALPQNAVLICLRQQREEGLFHLKKKTEEERIKIWFGNKRVKSKIGYDTIFASFASVFCSYFVVVAK